MHLVTSEIKRETGWPLSTAGVRILRRVAPSKQLLLHRVICDENPTNNGEAFIKYVGCSDHDPVRSMRKVIQFT